MRTRRWAALFLGLSLGVLLLSPPLATPSQAAGTPVIIEFRSKICPYCYQMAQILGDIERQYSGQISVQYYTMDTDEPMFKQYRVSLVPTIVILSPSGSEVYRHEGVVPKDAMVRTLKGLNYIRD